MSNHLNRVLVIEDDRELATLTVEYLSKHGMHAISEGDGERAVQRVRDMQPDVIVLDLMLPNKDGFEICRELRGSNISTPIVILTARDEDFDQVLGLELGADSYLTKPVQPRVLLAHLKAVLRRTDRAVNDAESSLRFGRLAIRHDARLALIDEKPVPLTTAEFDLLWILASNAGKVVQRRDILKTLRGLEYDGTDRSIDSRVSRLRKKLGDEAGRNGTIKTVRPHGYLFSPEAW